MMYRITINFFPISSLLFRALHNKLLLTSSPLTGGAKNKNIIQNSKSTKTAESHSASILLFCTSCKRAIEHFSPSQ